MAEKLCNDDAEEAIDEIATIAWVPIYPRDMAPAERVLAISSLLERCSKEPKSKLGEVLSDSPVGKDILNRVRAQLDKLKEEVEFTVALDKQ